MTRTSVDQRDQLAPDLRVRSFGLTDQGRVRTANEDQFLVGEMHRVLRLEQSSLAQPSELTGEHAAHLFLVADGIGGHSGGERASALAVETIEQFMLNTLRWLFGLRAEGLLAEFQAAVRAADASIFEEATRRPELRGMGTTLTLAFTTGSTLYVAHAGSSRCYLLRDRRLHQITRDHTLVEQLVREGVMSGAQAARSQFRHVITNAVGGDEPGIDVEVHKLGLERGDVLLLCTDGLTKIVPDEEIVSAITHAARPEAACRELVATANRLGGPDNVTVVLAFFEEPAQSVVARAPAPSLPIREEPRQEALGALATG